MLYKNRMQHICKKKVKNVCSIFNQTYALNFFEIQSICFSPDLKKLKITSCSKESCHSAGD